MDLESLIQADYSRFQAIFPDFLPVNFGDLDPEIQIGYRAGFYQLVHRLTDLGLGNVNSLGFGTVVGGVPATPFDVSGYHPWRNDQTFINSIINAAKAASSSSTPASQGG